MWVCLACVQEVRGPGAVLSIQPVGSGDQTWVLRLGGKCPYL